MLKWTHIVAGVLSLAAALLPLATANATATLLEHTILAYDSPVEWRLSCAKWASGKWPWGGGWKTCIGHKYQNLRHEYVFVVEVSGFDPESEQALRDIIAANLPSSNTDAALSKAQTAILATLAAHPLLKDAIAISMRVDHRTRWS
jgi:hypothetical protein